jgi:glucose-1-phosphate cytidylyltransferase
MKVVLFCGGSGMRLRGYSDDVPKPMVQIGTRPIMWHLMKYYAHFGHRDFILCLGYKGNCIKDYFLHYDESVSNNFVWSNGGKKVELLNRDMDDWTITFVETGANANIGQRLKAIEPYVQGEEMFLANYGDGLSDVSLPAMLDTFRESTAIASLLLVQPTASFDIVYAGSEGLVKEIRPITCTDIWINGGFFTMRNEIFRYIQPGEELVREPFQRLIDKQALLAHKYNGFWQCMDTFKDKQHLEELNQGAAPWKVWNHAANSLADCTRQLLEQRKEQSIAVSEHA